ncbi:MAG: UDP-3-O-[3-hydroxymyristoyl] N-acetylglucosamine deacetylase [Elusimicrobia bacterium RIFCSPLOWO2_02_FULL_39_32]|nr:MAG: UDP-3-O-[3-hydroxymyristoyl] N-acetylglucosamine deacetylase [Elusimicrobia bacterium GWA2_38_7]OGR79510.1 MAG: UDP-3-O-[3-hydroxymyristoyl] N-acetylglucosamine deacetylase [Elusimicrobia bacterium RIFCSPHIGHO2_02_FULL_39_36]OGR92836.1 MAG: UDP-3-O-[3-hydroxymyristoyl] N-acetylglucosamine deacetylase [Elusimicrobia bacterium RIFCSPLOWO2_02_FULL_39_32]OGR99620.1 MAG: UDP-3-O-[3-hydroxymyristoyl] N-acetylglucosamine deacetylase [Elusimicrobia bacterium RIFCSPLOWO2_12_FULL_39_28]
MIQHPNQKTIKKEASFAGIGLHTGNSSSLKFIPAPVNTGVIFIRKDLPGKPNIPATIDHVVGVVRGTTLGINGAQIHTVEHICSALLGLGIDNLLIEVDANEPPVADGSAKPFVEVLLSSGLLEQDQPKKILELIEPVIYKANETEIRIEPARNFSIHCQLIFNHPLIGKQEKFFQIDTETYIREIAPARTFCFDYEVEALKRKGLARGGSLDNAVVVGLDRIYNKEKKLRFEDEFVRHKILDFMGDFFLLGKTVLGKIDAIKVGHGHNINFVKELTKVGELAHGK